MFVGIDKINNVCYNYIFKLSYQSGWFGENKGKLQLGTMAHRATTLERVFK